jgi:hypothetical protein
VIELDAASAAIMEIASFGAPVTAMAAGGGGTIAVASEGDGIHFIGGAFDGKHVKEMAGRTLGCVIALLFSSETSLIIAIGSTENAPSQWKEDLLRRRATGEIWRLDLGTGKSERLAEKLAWPHGIGLLPNGDFVVSESWRHRLVRIPAKGGAPVGVLEDLPGYPARLAPASDGGFWLSVFAPRSQLIEFLLREPKFRDMMMREIASDYWIAPSLAPSKTFLEPLQGGGLKHLGVLKPWAPSRSYGLIIRLDPTLIPTASFHSRADGARHGIRSAVDVDGQLYFSSIGGEVVAVLPIENGDQP